MYLDIQKHRKNPIGIFRESVRKDGKVVKEDFGRVTGLPLETLYLIRDALQHRVVSSSDFKILNAKEYGGSYAFIQLAKTIGLDRIIYSNPSVEWVKLSLGMIIGRILYQGSKLSLTRISKYSTLWEQLNVQEAAQDVKRLYQAMDELAKRQERIQKKLFQNHYQEGSLILYDITSSYLEGDYIESELVAYGYHRDKKQGHPQVVIGLICNEEGMPLSIEVFKGNRQDQTTVAEKLKELHQTYKLKEVIFVGDRGMVKTEGLEEVLMTLGSSMSEFSCRYISALSHAQVRKFCHDKGITNQSDFSQNMEYTWEELPHRRLVVSYNPLRAQKDAQTRQSLIDKTAQSLEEITLKKRPVNDGVVGVRVGKVINRYKVSKFFTYTIENGTLKWEIKQEAVEDAARYDGLYVIASDVDKTSYEASDLIQAYRQLSHVESAFRSLKGSVLQVRPIYHRTDTRIETHIFICFLSYYLEWHFIQCLKPIWEENQTGQGWNHTVIDVINELKQIQQHEIAFEDTIIKKITEYNQRQEKMMNLLLK